MRRGFIRALWGDLDIRSGKLRSDIHRIKNSEFEIPFVVYVFGSENYGLLTDMGFDCVLVDSNTHKWDLGSQMYRHKLEILKIASDDFDEFVYLDWDCVQIANCPDDFWRNIGKKAPFQANLFQYRTKKCLWRDSDWRKVCNGGFIYIRDKNIPLEFIRIYDELHEWVIKQKVSREKRGKELRFREKALIFDDEPAMSRWVDDFMGGWKGLETYWNEFEPEYCNLRKKSAFSDEQLNSKPSFLVHML